MLSSCCWELLDGLGIGCWAEGRHVSPWPCLHQLLAQHLPIEGRPEEKNPYRPPLKRPLRSTEVGAMPWECRFPGRKPGDNASPSPPCGSSVLAPQYHISQTTPTLNPAPAPSTCIHLCLLLGLACFFFEVFDFELPFQNPKTPKKPKTLKAQAPAAGRCPSAFPCQGG